MKFLINKTILIISPQNWGKMLLSKHHYAIELARAGNKVYFLNPPDTNKRIRYNSVSVLNNELHPNLFEVNHRLYFPYFLKFRAMGLFQLLMQPHIKKVLGTIGKPVDIIWSFDIGNLYPFRLFPKNSLKIFHPVDEPLSAEAINAARGAGIIFSVTNEILEKYKGYPVRKEFINHGVNADFLNVLNQKERVAKFERLKVGYAGNMLRPDLDRPTLLKIIEENSAVEFNFYGSFEVKQTNIGGEEDEATIQFIKKLKQFSQVKLHGVLEQVKLAEDFISMDAFLVCYDIEKDQSKGTNYHKLMEYMATGKIVIANNISTYSDRPDLIKMPLSRKNNDELPKLFKEVISSLKLYNSNELSERRKAFAASNTYTNQIARIDSILSQEFFN